MSKCAVHIIYIILYGDCEILTDYSLRKHMQIKETFSWIWHQMCSIKEKPQLLKKHIFPYNSQLFHKLDMKNLLEY